LNQFCQGKKKKEKKLIYLRIFLETFSVEGMDKICHSSEL